jgi:hypothetical protein
MDELNMDDLSIPTFLLKSAPRPQADALDAFRNAIRVGDVTWIDADYPADRACTAKDCLGALRARLYRRIGAMFAGK